MKDVFKITRDIIETYKEANEKMVLINNKMININHEIELSEELSKSDKIALFDRLKEALAERRTCKDVLSMIPRIFGDIELLENKLLGQEKFYNTRTFTPRIECGESNED